jgi:hypothetical protein
MIFGIILWICGQSISGFSLKHIPFSIELPKNWIYREGPGPVVLAAFSDDTSETGNSNSVLNLGNIVITNESAGRDTLELINKDPVAYLQELQLKFYRKPRLGPGSKKIFNGIPGAYIHLFFENSKGLQLYNSQFSFIEGAHLYSVVVTSAANDSIRNDKVSESILATLKHSRSHD